MMCKFCTQSASLLCSSMFSKSANIKNIVQVLDAKSKVVRKLMARRRNSIPLFLIMLSQWNIIYGNSSFRIESRII